MKLIITSQGPGMTDSVDPRFGRAQFFMLVDEDTGDHQSLDNGELASAPQGAGVQAAQNVVASGASVLLTGRCGPKAYQVLTAAGVTIYSGATGTVEDALDAWRRGALSPLASADGTPQH